MRVLSVSWNMEYDLTKIKFNDAFEQSDWIVKADVLQDIIGELTEKYNNVLASQRQGRNLVCHGTAEFILATKENDDEQNICI